MDSNLISAGIGAGVAIIGTAVGAFFSFRVSQHQRAVDLIVAALTHMGGGSQQRSAGIAALSALRGKYRKKPRRRARGVWKNFGPAVGQQIYRQLIYLLYHGQADHRVHEAENLIAMMAWLLDDKVLGFDDIGRRHRLATAVDAYRARVNLRDAEVPLPEVRESALDVVARQVPGWLSELTSGGHHDRSPNDKY